VQVVIALIVTPEGFPLAYEVLRCWPATRPTRLPFPTADGRTLIFCRSTMPNKTQKLLLAQLGLELPPQSPPRITSNRSLEPLPA
jgi:hypothetical protein